MVDAAPLAGRALVQGTAQARALTSDEPLSFWGGYDQLTGEIIDRRHPLSGENAAGSVQGTDKFLTLAAIVAEEMYGRTVGIVSLDAASFASLAGAREIRVDDDGTVTRIA